MLSDFIRPREAGEGDHWSSRSERTVVEGAQELEASLPLKTVKAGKFETLRA